MIIWIIFGVILSFFLIVILNNLIMQRKLIKDLTATPGCATLLEYARKKKIRIAPDVIYDIGKPDYCWLTDLRSGKIISISLDPKTKKILPIDDFLRKIIFAHEIGHTEQLDLYFDLKYSCKILKDGGSCIYLELDAWNKALELLLRLHLLQNDLEIAKFWEYVNSKPCQEKFSNCKIKAENGSCPKTLELRMKVFR